MAPNGTRSPKDNVPSSTSPHHPFQIPDSHSHDQAGISEKRSPWQQQKSSSKVIASGKRKAGLAVEPRTARRRRMDTVRKGQRETDGKLMDTHYMRRTLQLPTSDDYPTLPPGSLLEKPKKDAENAAYLHLIAKMHEERLINDLFKPKLVPDKLDKRTLQEERDAKLDIYNYAARYGCVPEITINEIASATAKDRRRVKKVDRKFVEVRILLRELDIEAVGRGVNLVNAEIAASINIKRQAEEYQAKQGTDSLVIKDFTSLNVENARGFFEWYKINDPGAQIELRTIPKMEYASFGGPAFESQVSVDGKKVGTPVLMSTKKKSEDLAYLSAAVECTRTNSTLLPRFFQALRSSTGEILRPVGPIDMPIHDECILLMRDTLLKAQRLGLKDEDEGLQSEEEVAEVRRGKPRPILGQTEAARRSLQLERAYSEYLQRPDLAELRQKREELPMNQYRAKVLEIVNNNTYSIIVGATGSGKTTQVPQILLEQAIQNRTAAACNIICTQPRRIAATSVAKRVAEERAERLQASVGYHVRFDAKLPQVGGSMTYCTTGILLQQLQHSPDEIFDSTSHLIIDEVHERDMQIDFLLIILKKVMAQRIRDGKSIPKVVLMSATMDADLFASYFKNTTPEGETSSCPTLSVPGRTFPVKEQHLEHILATLDKTYRRSELQPMYNDLATREYFEVEKSFAKDNPLKSGIRSATPEGEEEESIIDWKRARVMSADGEVVMSNEKEEALVPVGLVAITIAHIAKSTTEGAVLVFLPGLPEIVKVDDLLRNGDILGVDFQNQSKYKIYMLHSSIAAGQNEVFEQVPKGCRKIILGTNIAETSITIPDVQYVVDTGKLREKQYDQLRRITKLQCTWISKSNSKQRAGRAGRVQNGNYYALFSQQRYEALRAIGMPELLRSDLQETCLDVKAQAFKAPIREFLAEAIEAPSPSAVNTAVLGLQTLNALTDEENITALGRLLASLPVHPALGKMIVLGVIFRCLDPMLLLGAAAEERQLFNNPLGLRREAQAAKESFGHGSASDHIAFLNAFREMRQMRESESQQTFWDFSNRKFLHQGAFKSIDSTARQIEEVLVEAKLIPFTPPSARRDYEYGHPELNENSSKVHVIKALALAGLHPNLAVATGGRSLRTPGEKGTILHPSSVNALDDRRVSGPKYGTLFSYTTMAKSNDGRTIYLRDTTASTPLMATLFGGRLQAPSPSGRQLAIDDWLPFYVKADDRRALQTILAFRKALDRLLTGAFADLSRKKFLAEDPLRECFAEGVVEILDRELRSRGKYWDSVRQGSEVPTARPMLGGSRWAAGKRESRGWGWNGAM
ncbi:hypothetical protein MMC13_001240 [Lambiella insularis]|nr:hypothetical protein [Lambiella insularis]